ncbi:Tat pathway signal sequence domain protein [Isoptericola sp. NPDC019571]|uniref:exo-rhamnogalacturonan lyase family protein n=1 Tax=Isoptericola sp. NPDC019571 TaxID=3364008 RepID=UPI0037AF8D71
MPTTDPSTDEAQLHLYGPRVVRLAGAMSRSASLRWLEPEPAGLAGGVTWGVPWPQGAVPADAPFALRDSRGRGLPVQSWTTASWPDGSVKWSAHCAAPATPDPSGYTLHPGRRGEVATRGLEVTQHGTDTLVDTGTMRATIPARGPVMIATLEAGGRVVARDGRLLSELAMDPEGRSRTPFEGVVESVTVEQSGPVRAVLLVKGRHSDGRRHWMPFRVRLVFHASSDQIRVVHTMIWDADPDRDFLCALGLRFDVPMDAPLHDRHVRIAGSSGFLTESVRPVTGLWRDPGAAARAAQVAGRPTPPTHEWTGTKSYLDPPPTWDDRLRHVPAWNDWTLTQLSADGYTLRKRTGESHGWVTIPSGTRSRGYAYLGSVHGGLELGLRGFWQSHPTQLDVRGAATDHASLTAWMWSPEAQPMDLRFYHAGEHEQTDEGQLAALEVTYEDYKPGFGDASGIARTHELLIRAAPTTPDHETLDAHARANANPPQLVCAPDYLHDAGVFGHWSLPDRSNAAAAPIEDRLQLLADYYADQVEERRWYGFWDYGDVMHSYDTDRHTWRYDIGGYAWDNSELSTDLWLWYHYLRTGDAKAFRLAEAMTRHTGEVDVYHLGRFAGFGTRHNVQHWGCSCKQLRVSSPVYRRFLYFLTADERVGELLDEVAVTGETFAALDHHRAVGARQGRSKPDPRGMEVDLGIDFGAILASWFTRWERTGDPDARRRIIETLTDIGTMPRGYFTGVARLDPATGRFDTTEDRVTVSHLSAVFGIVEVLAEILDLLDLPEFEETWLQYCQIYLASPEVQEAATGTTWNPALQLAHTRLLAWAAHRLGDEALATRAWTLFHSGPADRANLNQLDPDRRPDPVAGLTVAEPVSELAGVTTNDAAQYGLAAIQNLALVSEWLGETAPEPSPTHTR